MYPQAPSLESSLARRAQSYFGYAQFLCALLVGLTIAMDVLVVGPSTEQILLRVLEGALPVAADAGRVLAGGIDQPSYQCGLTSAW